MQISQLPTTTLLATIASESIIDQSYGWLCKQRQSHPPNADIWRFRYHWKSNRIKLIDPLSLGVYLASSS